MKNIRNYIFTTVLAALLSVEMASAANPPKEDGLGTEKSDVSVVSVSVFDEAIIGELEEVKKRIQRSDYISPFAKSIFSQMPLSSDCLRVIVDVKKYVEALGDTLSATAGDLFTSATADLSDEDNLSALPKVEPSIVEPAKEGMKRYLKTILCRNKTDLSEKDEEIGRPVKRVRIIDSRENDEKVIGQAKRIREKMDTASINAFVERIINEGTYFKADSRLRALRSSHGSKKGIVCGYFQDLDDLSCTIAHEFGHALDETLRELYCTDEELQTLRATERNAENISMFLENLFFSSDEGKTYLFNKTHNFKKFRFAEIFFDFLMKGFVSEFVQEFQEKEKEIEEKTQVSEDNVISHIDGAKLREFDSVKKYFGEGGVLSRLRINQEIIKSLLASTIKYGLEYEYGGYMLYGDAKMYLPGWSKDKTLDTNSSLYIKCNALFPEGRCFFKKNCILNEEKDDYVMSMFFGVDFAFGIYDTTYSAKYTGFDEDKIKADLSSIKKSYYYVLNDYLGSVITKLKSGTKIDCESHVAGDFYGLRQIKKDGLLGKLNGGHEVDILPSVIALQSELPESLNEADVCSTFKYLLEEDAQ